MTADLLRRAQQALAEGAYRTAQALFAQVVAQNPRSADAYFGLALACGYLRAYQDAADHFRACTELDPRRAAAHINLGVAYVLMGRPDDAIAALRKGLQLAPQSPLAYYNLGIAYRAKGVLDLAAEAFREAIRKDPRLVPAYLNLANVLFDLGRYREARTWYEEGLKVEPDNGALKQGLAAVERAESAGGEPVAEREEAAEPASDVSPVQATPFATVVERADALAEVLELAVEQEKLVEAMLKVIEDVIRPAVGALSHSLVHSGAGKAELDLHVEQYRQAMGQIDRAAERLAEGVRKLSFLGERFAANARR